MQRHLVFNVSDTFRSYIQLKERFKVHRKITEIEQHKTEFEIEQCTNDEQMIAKIY